LLCRSSVIARDVGKRQSRVQGGLRANIGRDHHRLGLEQRAEWNQFARKRAAGADKRLQFFRANRGDAGVVVARPAASRGGLSFRAAAGALAVLFARSYARAGDIHRAMLARGFSGRFHPLAALRFLPADARFTALACAAPIFLRFAAERLA
jgi:hypothetical protein